MVSMSILQVVEKVLEQYIRRFERDVQLFADTALGNVAAKQEAVALLLHLMEKAFARCNGRLAAVAKARPGIAPLGHGQSSWRLSKPGHLKASLPPLPRFRFSAWSLASSWSGNAPSASGPRRRRLLFESSTKNRPSSSMTTYCSSWVCALGCLPRYMRTMGPENL